MQPNGYDCGVYVCLNAEEMARVGYVRKQHDTSNVRRKIMMNIFKGKLHRYEFSDCEDFLVKASQRNGSENLVKETQKKFVKELGPNGLQHRVLKEKIKEEVKEKKEKSTN